jgi:hypothetical protein
MVRMWSGQETCMKQRLCCVNRIIDKGSCHSHSSGFVRHESRLVSSQHAHYYETKESACAHYYETLEGVSMRALGRSQHARTWKESACAHLEGVSMRALL